MELTDKGSGGSSADWAAGGAEGAGRSSREMAGKGSGRSAVDTAGEGAEGAGRLGSRTSSGSEVLGRMGSDSGELGRTGSEVLGKMGSGSGRLGRMCSWWFWETRRPHLLLAGPQFPTQMAKRDPSNGDSDTSWVLACRWLAN